MFPPNDELNASAQHLTYSVYWAVINACYFCFREGGKEVVKGQNKIANGGKMKCANCKREVKPAKQHKRGETPPKNEAHGDHKVAKSKGGRGNPDNGQVTCRTCNLEKSNDKP